MRSVVLLLLLCSFASAPALAGKNAGGALIVHTNDANGYTANVCLRFETVDNPGTCVNAGVRSDKDPATPALVWLLAAFPNGSNPGVVVIYFGLNHNLPVGAGYFDRWGFCGPAGSLEIPDTGWPEVGGNSVAFGTPIVGDILFPYYFFNVYGDPGSFLGTGINPTGGYAAFVDDSNPPVQDNITCFGHMAWGTFGDNNCECIVSPPTEACCFEDGHCEDLAASDCSAAGGTPQGFGSSCAGVVCPPPLEACCFCPDGHCEDLLPDDCVAAGGAPQGPGTSCANIQCDCPPPLEACCFCDLHCEDLLADECIAVGGIPQGAGTSCETVFCDQPPGACCLPNGDCIDTVGCECEQLGGEFHIGSECGQLPCEPTLEAACCVGGECRVTTQADCEAVGGVWFPDQASCDPPFECPPVATEPTSWGRIKADYR